MRMALGAAPRDILKLILKQGLLLTLVGGAIGLLGAYAATRVMSSLLFGITPKDPLTFMQVTIILVCSVFRTQRGAQPHSASGH